jgi:N-acetylneuraminic acid mutarotase
MLDTVLALSSFALASCGDDTTQPNTAADPADQPPSIPQLAVTSNTWLTRANVPSDRRQVTTATVTNAAGETILYAIGGKTLTSGWCSGTLSKVQAYNAATNTWTNRASLPAPLTETNGAGVINGKIYVSGGCFGYKAYSRQLWMYDPVANTWTQKHPMPFTSFAGTTGVINDQLYVMASCDGQEDCEGDDPAGYPYYWGFLRYNPASDTWTRLRSPANGDVYSHGAAATIGKKFYVTGGWLNRATEAYDPATNTWANKASMGSPRYDAAYVASAAKFYIMGGVRTNPDGSRTVVATTSVYDPATNIWTHKAPMPTARTLIAAGRVVVNGQTRLSVVGGLRPGNHLQYIP